MKTFLARENVYKKLNNQLPSRIMSNVLQARFGQKSCSNKSRIIRTGHNRELKRILAREALVFTMGGKDIVLKFVQPEDVVLF